MEHQGEVITDPLEITRLICADDRCECERKQKVSETSQFQDIVDLIRGVDGRHEEDIATALLTKFKMERV